MAPTQSEDNNPSAEYKLKKYLLLLATLVVSVTYVAGLNLPGGVWQEDGDTKEGHHLAGDLILLSTHLGRYLTFYYCNATAFAASVVVCLLLLILQEGNNGVCETVLRVVMVLDLLGLTGAYAAGSCRDTFTTIYSTLVMSVVLAYAVLTFSLYIISKLEKCKDDKQQQKEDHESQSQSREEKDKVASSEVLMLLATFVVTITYGGGLSPPGGFWGNGHRVSLPILQDHSSARYQAFFVCNTTAFVASLLIIMLLLDKRLKKELSVRSVALYGLIVVASLGPMLLGAAERLILLSM
jgi:H+/gluconate symporter-like permease